MRTFSVNYLVKFFYGNIKVGVMDFKADNLESAQEMACSFVIFKLMEDLDAGDEWNLGVQSIELTVS